MREANMRRGALLAALLASAGFATTTVQAKDASPRAETAISVPDETRGIFEPVSVNSTGSVTIAGKRIDYKATAGTIVIHPEGWDDSLSQQKTKPDSEKQEAAAEASVFYVAYFKKGEQAADRPVMFLFNGGPGSATVWLHMGAFGPRRVLTPDALHSPAAPYKVVENPHSLLDVADLVFIDAPGAGFSRVAGKEKEKAFYGIDADARAFGNFIKAFLTRYGRWNSPRYVLGESYGTPRSAVLSGKLHSKDMIDLNGVILLSAALNFDLQADWPQFNPGNDGPYIVSLPTYAATAWYHKRLPGGRPAELEPFLAEVERFATTDYAAALLQGDQLPADRRKAIADRMARYIGLPVDYILKSNLRINVGQFTQNLASDTGQTVGRVDTRFIGPTLDPLSREADYDPQQVAIASAYVSAFNDYARTTLGFATDRAFKLSASDVDEAWTYVHQPPGAPGPLAGAGNTMPDLATAMKYNTNLRVLLLGGYYDLATPYFEGKYEMRHLGVPDELKRNIESHYYPSGHMMYLHDPSLAKLHDDVAKFVRRGGRKR